MKPTDYQKYEWAKKRAKDIKGFYNHLLVYIIIMVMLVIARFYILPQYVEMDDLGPDGIYWINANVVWTGALWGLGVLIHGLWVKKSRLKFLNRWEERKIKEIMEEEDHRESPRWQ